MSIVASALLKYKVMRLTAASLQTVNFGQVYAFEKTASWSCSVWVRRSSDPGVPQSLFDKRSTAPNFRGWSFGLGGSGVLASRLGFGTGGGSIDRYSNPTSLNDGDWHHLVMTYDGSQSSSGIVYWFDATDPGVSSVVNTLSGSIVDTGDFCVGSRNQTDSYFTGDIQDAAVFPGVLSEEDVTALYNRNVPPNLLNLSLSQPASSYWILGEHVGDPGTATGVPVGSNVPDLGTNNFDGTLLNSAPLVTRI